MAREAPTAKPMRSRVLLSVVLLFSVTTSGRAQWDPETPMTATGGDVWGEGIAAAGSTIHLVFGAGDINYRRSTNEGSTWSEAKSIGAGTLHLTDPIVADGNDVWVIYLDGLQNMNDWCCQRDLGSVWLLRSRDGGDTWDSPRQLSTSNTAFRVSIAYAANRLHLVWADFRSGAWDTYYLRSPDRGESWDPEVLIAASTGPFGAERPQVAARGDSVHVTIWDDRDNNPSCMSGAYLFPKCPDVFHMRSIDGGASWDSIVNVAKGGAGFAGRNDIAVAGSSGVIINYNVEVPGESGSKLFAIASSDDGATWADPIRLTTSENESDHGSIIGSGNSAYLVWHDDRDPSNREIYYRQTRNAGVSWDDEEPVSSGAAGDSSTPLNAVTPGFTHVIWIDNRGGNYQVYYRRRALQSVPPADGGVADGGTQRDPDAAAGGSGVVDSGATRPSADAGESSAGRGDAAGGSNSSARGGASGNTSADAGSRPDANPSSGSGAHADAGTSEGAAKGCGCTIVRARWPARAPATFLLALLVVSRHRRRRRSMSAARTL